MSSSVWCVIRPVSVVGVRFSDFHQKYQHRRRCCVIYCICIIGSPPHLTYGPTCCVPSGIDRFPTPICPPAPTSARLHAKMIHCGPGDGQIPYSTLSFLEFYLRYDRHLGRETDHFVVHERHAEGLARAARGTRAARRPTCRDIVGPSTCRVPRARCSTRTRRRHRARGDRAALRRGRWGGGRQGIGSLSRQGRSRR